MAKISERVDGYVEQKRKDWGGPLGKFLGDVIAGGAKKTMEDVEPGFTGSLKEIFNRIADNERLPQDLRDIAGQAAEGKKQWQIILAVILAPLILIPMVTAVFQPFGRLLTYAEDVWVRSYRFDPSTVLEIFKRDKTKYLQFRQDLRELGVSDERITALEELSKYIPGV